MQVASEDSNRTAQDALMYWTRSAAQGDVDAMVKLGDLHYSGLGVNEPAALRYEKAAGYYQTAIDSHSAIAMWNVGWMYENGVGAPQVSEEHWLFGTRSYYFRTFTLPNAITTWHSNTTVVLTSPSFSL